VPSHVGHSPLTLTSTPLSITHVVMMERMRRLRDGIERVSVWSGRGIDRDFFKADAIVGGVRRRWRDNADKAEDWLDDRIETGLEDLGVQGNHRDLAHTD
jgi:hypothetical protein